MKKKGDVTDPLIRKVKAKKLIKTLQANEMDISETAKDLEITPQGVRDQIRNNPHVRSGLQSMLDALEKAGANDEKAARVINEAMDAEKATSVEDFTDDDTEEDRQKEEKKGRSFRTIYEPDHAIRLKANEQYAKIKRLIGEDDGRLTPPAGNIEAHFHFHKMTKEEVQDFIKGKLQK